MVPQTSPVRTVLLVALGRMGERYLDVLQGLHGRLGGEPLHLLTVDPKFPSHPENHHFSSLSEVPDDVAIDLAIDARPNTDRLKVLSWFLERRIPHIVVEKPSAASLQEAEAMMALVEKASYNPRVLVPFNRRFMGPWQPEILGQLKAGPLKTMVISCGAIGLGCNGVHYLDLANWLFGTPPTDVYGQLDTNSIPSPRGPQYADHSGTLIANYGSGRRLILHIQSDSADGIQTTLMYERGKIQVLEQQEPQWQWYVQPEGHQELPHYRTHLEKSIEPPMAFSLSLPQLIETGLMKLLSGEAIPSLQESYDVLKTIHMAMESQILGRRVAWQEATTCPEIVFQFT